MTISLFQKIQALHPELTSDDFLNRVIILQDDGDGAYIREWNHPTIPQPTNEELDGVDATAYLNDKAFELLRVKRNQLLAETDYLALADVTLTDEMRSYRQALRDLPANTVDPANPVWPIKPS
jgi:hypothetical protein